MSTAHESGNVYPDDTSGHAQTPETTTPEPEAATHTITVSAPKAARIAPANRAYDVVAVFFVAFLLLSNIGATKLISLGTFSFFGIDFSPIFDGGAILFPLTYILGDVLSEVYGFAKARRVIILGFASSLLGSLTFWLVQIAPPAQSYENQAAFEAVLGVVPRFVLASMVGYLVGQILNSWVLVRIKERWGKKHLWARLIGSTVVGEMADTLLFCTIAWVGVISWADIANLAIVGYAYKVALETILLPVTYAVIGWVKRYEGMPA